MTIDRIPRALGATLTEIGHEVLGVADTAPLLDREGRIAYVPAVLRNDPSPPLSRDELRARLVAAVTVLDLMAGAGTKDDRRRRLIGICSARDAKVIRWTCNALAGMVTGDDAQYFHAVAREPRAEAAGAISRLLARKNASPVTLAATMARHAGVEEGAASEVQARFLAAWKRRGARATRD